MKGTDEFVTRAESLVPLMYHDPSDLGSLILIHITPKERTLIQCSFFYMHYCANQRAQVCNALSHVINE